MSLVSSPSAVSTKEFSSDYSVRKVNTLLNSVNRSRALQFWFFRSGPSLPPNLGILVLYNSQTDAVSFPFTPRPVTPMVPVHPLTPPRACLPLDRISPFPAPPLPTLQAIVIVSGPVPHTTEADDFLLPRFLPPSNLVKNLPFPISL